jgi:hypothetical protein
VEVFAALFADGLPWDIDGHAIASFHDHDHDHAPIDATPEPMVAGRGARGGRRAAAAGPAASQRRTTAELHDSVHDRRRRAG